jgi:drug/metabolite transporter (DMT)-like permease
MKPAVIVGVILIVLGAVALAYQGITYTSQEKVVDLGPLKVEAKKEKTIPLPPLLGALLLVGGVVLVAVSVRR